MNLAEVKPPGFCLICALDERIHALLSESPLMRCMSVVGTVGGSSSVSTIAEDLYLLPQDRDSLYSGRGRYERHHGR